MKPTFEDLLSDARQHQPDTAPAELGFTTRLSAVTRQLNKENAASFIDLFGNWLWRSAFGFVPLIAILFAVAIISNNSITSIPEGADNFVTYVVNTLPEPTLFIR